MTELQGSVSREQEETKMDEAKKLSLNELGDVSGGTPKECKDIINTFNNEASTYCRRSVPSDLVTQDVDNYAATAESILAGIGIKAKTTDGTGYYYSNNRYWDTEGEQYITHKEVLHLIKPGDRPWRWG